MTVASGTIAPEGWEILDQYGRRVPLPAGQPIPTDKAVYIPDGNGSWRFWEGQTTKEEMFYMEPKFRAAFPSKTVNGYVYNAIPPLEHPNFEVVNYPAMILDWQRAISARVTIPPEGVYFPFREQSLDDFIESLVN